MDDEGRGAPFLTLPRPVVPSAAHMCSQHLRALVLVLAHVWCGVCSLPASNPHPSHNYAVRVERGGASCAHRPLSCTTCTSRLAVKLARPGSSSSSSRRGVRRVRLLQLACTLHTLDFVCR